MVASLTVTVAVAVDSVHVPVFQYAPDAEVTSVLAALLPPVPMTPPVPGLVPPVGELVPPVLLPPLEVVPPVVPVVPPVGLVPPEPPGLPDSGSHAATSSAKHAPVAHGRNLVMPQASILPAPNIASNVPPLRCPIPADPIFHSGPDRAGTGRTPRQGGSPGCGGVRVARDFRSTERRLTAAPKRGIARPHQLRASPPLPA